MKRVLIIIIVAAFYINANSQTYKSDSIKHDGLTRHYLLYVPNIYNPNKPTPLVFNLHGLGSNSLEQIFYGNFMPIADTANFILVVPDGTAIAGSQFWNIGIIPSSIDDVGFLESLIDTLALEYNINRNRVYSTGMSNGGFMSYYLACHSKRFTAIASVTGSETIANFSACTPSRPTPAMEIHGTADSTVPYNGNTLFKPIEDVVNYWVNFNKCNTTPAVTNVPDINTKDSSNAVHYIYNGGTNGSTVEFFKVIGGGHTWPGTAYPSKGTCLDFNACVEIWRFFSKYSTDKLQGIEKLGIRNYELRIFPNPAANYITIENKSAKINRYLLILRNIEGKEILRENAVLSNTYKMDLSTINNGIYFLTIQNDKENYVKKVVVER